MSAFGVPDAGSQLWGEGEEVTLTFTRIDAFTGRLTWTMPKIPRAYDGILITASIREINPSNFPTDGVKYTASQDLSAPSDSIGSAQVVVAAYGDKTTGAADLTGMDIDQVYFFSAHAVSAVRTYYTSGVRSYPESGKVLGYAPSVPRKSEPPTNPTLGLVYFNEVDQRAYSWDGSAWIPVTSHTVLSGEIDPVVPVPDPSPYPTGYPAFGDFFYNYRTRVLKHWDGTQWVVPESEDPAPMFEKQSVGTDTTNNIRNDLIAVLKNQLGEPEVCVELGDYSFNIAITNALMELRRKTDSAYTRQYFFMTMHPFQQKYYLNDPTRQTDKIVDVIKIHRLNLLGLNNFAPDNIYAQQFLNHFYAPGVAYDIVSIHLIHALSEVYSQIFAGEVAYNWSETSRILSIFKIFGHQEKVILETSCEKTEQELLVDRWTQQWVQQWARSELLFMLAMRRGKYGNLPGPGGGLSLNADVLMAESTRLKEDCLRQVADFEVGQQGPDNFYPQVIMG